uniref:NADH-ubiquinone oxidoreductase chain 2 n=1 Tax=Mahanarva spectabilis TaxID=1985197 RepID=A0A343YVJ1_9HEMI|nr:NADH dehydrogenase subunit 2 [Mahanarva spectabilis]
MLMNSTKLLLLIFLFMSTIFSLSSNNWFGSWLGLEMNMMSFIPIMYKKNNYYSSESMMKYFIIQSMGSTILLLGVMMVNSITLFNMNLFLVNCSLLIKLGISPFHMWLPSIMQSMSWTNCMIMSTWQKIALLFILSYTIDKFTIIFIIMSLIIGSIGGINQSSIKKMMAYSSINNMAWMMASMQISMTLLINYFMIYSMLTIFSMLLFKKMKINYLNQCMIKMNSPFNKMSLTMMMFSLGGMPPLMGFLPKFIIIQYMIAFNSVSTKIYYYSMYNCI